MINAVLMQASGLGNYSQLLMFGLLFVIFYFFMIRPQQQKQKEVKKYIESIKKGDWVVTIGGLHGKIAEIDDLIVVLEVDKTLIKFDRAAISMESTKKAYPAEKK